LLFVISGCDGSAAKADMICSPQLRLALETVRIDAVGADGDSRMVAFRNCAGKGDGDPATVSHMMKLSAGLAAAAKVAAS